MEKRDHVQSSSGFLLGVIIGCLLTLLLTTKKGRKILRVLIDEGLGKINDLEDFLKSQEAHNEKKIDTLVASVTQKVEDIVTPVVTNVNHTVSQATETATEIVQNAKVSLTEAIIPSAPEDEMPTVTEVHTSSLLPPEANPGGFHIEEVSERVLPKAPTNHRRFFRGIPKR